MRECQLPTLHSHLRTLVASGLVFGQFILSAGGRVCPLADRTGGNTRSGFARPSRHYGVRSAPPCALLSNPWPARWAVRRLAARRFRRRAGTAVFSCGLAYARPGLSLRFLSVGWRERLSSAGVKDKTLPPPAEKSFFG